MTQEEACFCIKMKLSKNRVLLTCTKSKFQLLTLAPQTSRAKNSHSFWSHFKIAVDSAFFWFWMEAGGDGVGVVGRAEKWMENRASFNKVLRQSRYRSPLLTWLLKHTFEKHDNATGRLKYQDKKLFQFYLIQFKCTCENENYMTKRMATISW